MATAEQYLSATEGLKSYLDELDRDLKSNRLNDTIIKLREDLFSEERNWSTIFTQYRSSLKEMPREICGKIKVESIIEELDDFETFFRYFLHCDYSSSKELPPYREVYSENLNTLTQKVGRLSQLIDGLKSNSIIEKFIGGEIILSAESDLQWKRKVWHVCAGSFFLYWIAYSGVSEFLKWSVAGFFMVGLLTLEVIRHTSPRFNRFFWKFFRPIMRESEKEHINTSVFFVLSMMSVYALFPLKVGILSMLFLTFGDPAASTIGILYGRHKIKSHFTLEGFLACWLVCAVVATIWVGWLYTPSLSGLSLVSFSVLGGFVAAMSEIALPKLDDNLVMPLLSAPFIYLLLSIFDVL